VISDFTSATHLVAEMGLVNREVLSFFYFISHCLTAGCIARALRRSKMQGPGANFFRREMRMESHQMLVFSHVKFLFDIYGNGVDGKELRVRAWECVLLF
jgi:hypothetical protein